MKALSLTAMFLAAAPALAFEIPALPLAWCTDPVELMRTSQRCEENRNLVTGAESCLQKLEILEKKFGVEAAAIARSGLESQRSQNNTGGTEYKFSAESLAHLISVAELAHRELIPYHDHYFPPGEFYTESSGSDPFGYADRTDCEGGNRRRVLSVQQKFLDKIARFKQRRAESLAHNAKLKVRGAGYETSAKGSVAKTIKVDNKIAAKGFTGAKSRNPASKITGVEVDRAKRAKAR